MKFNWGIGAFLLFGGFVVFIIVMVVLASNQTHELVTENYYEKELTYNDILEKKERMQQLKDNLTWTITNRKLTIQFPVTNTTPVKGVAYFFKPSSEADDKEIPFNTTSNSLNIDISQFSPGMYKMKLDWSCNGLEYYNEQKLDIPPK